MEIVAFRCAAPKYSPILNSYFARVKLSSEKGRMSNLVNHAAILAASMMVCVLLFRTADLK